MPSGLGAIRPIIGRVHRHRKVVPVGMRRQDHDQTLACDAGGDGWGSTNALTSNYNH